MAPTESDRWGNLTGDDIAKRLAEIAVAASPLKFPYSFLAGAIVSTVLFPPSEGGAARAIAVLKAELQDVSNKMDVARAQLEATAKEIQWTRLTLEAQPAADRIRERFEKLQTVDLGHPRLARQLADTVLDFNQGVLVDLTTLHYAIVGIDPIDPGQVSLIEAWMASFKNRPNLAQSVGWINQYFTHLVHLQLQGLILLINALNAEQEVDLAHESVKMVSACVSQQIALLRSMDFPFTANLGIPRDTNFIYPNGPFCDDGQDIVGTPTRAYPPPAGRDVVSYSTDSRLHDAGVLASMPDSPPNVISLASFNGTFFAAGLADVPSRSAGGAVVMAFDPVASTWVERLNLPSVRLARGLLCAHHHTLYAAFAGTIAATTDGINWSYDVHSPIELPVLLFAYEDRTYAAWERHVDGSLLVSAFTWSGSRFDFDDNPIVVSGPFQGLGDPLTNVAVFRDHFVVVGTDRQIAGPPDRESFKFVAVTRFMPLVTLVQRIAGDGYFGEGRRVLPNPDQASQLGFSGVLGAGEAFQLALFTGPNATYVSDPGSDRHLRMVAVADLHLVLPGGVAV